MSVSTNKWFSKQKIYHDMASCYHYLNQYKFLKFFLKTPKKIILFFFTFADGFYKKTKFYALPKGVNLVGHIESEKGVGEGVRLTGKIVSLTNWPYVWNNIIEEGSSNIEKIESIDEYNPYNINLIGVTVDIIHAICHQKGKNYFAGRYNILYAVCETEKWPTYWLSQLKYINEIWVPSHFVRTRVEKIYPLPVFYLPYVIESKDHHLPQFDREYFQLPKNAYIFFFMFDFSSEMQRKNPHGLIWAFEKAFKGKEDVFLLIKSSRGSLHPKKQKALSRIARNKNVIFLDKIMLKEEVNALMQITDCYVSLHRSEGFGLTIADAMSYGKPVIATDYSGNVDFMTDDTCYPVNYQLVELKKNYGHYEKGNYWAQPDLDQAAEHMRFVYENPEHAVQTGEKAKKYIADNFNAEIIAKMCQKRLDDIAVYIDKKRSRNFLKFITTSMKLFPSFDKHRQNE